MLVNKDWVLYQLRQARGEIDGVIDRLESNSDDIESEFKACMTNVYQRLNSAWNSRVESSDSSYDYEDFIESRKHSSDMNCSE